MSTFTLTVTATDASTGDTASASAPFTVNAPAQADEPRSFWLDQGLDQP